MSLLTDLLRPQTRAYSPIDDYWYKDIGTTSLTGVPISADSAMKISAVWACVNRIAGSLAAIPLPIMERTENGRKPATDYYLYDVIHNQPNANQTSIEWREMMTSHALLRGNGYCEIVQGRRGAAEELIPLHPDYVTPEQQINGQWRSGYSLTSGPIRYKVRGSHGEPDRMLDDSNIFHLKGISNGGLSGISIIQNARESFGLSLAIQQYGARWFSQDGHPGGILTHPNRLTPDAQKNLKESWGAAHSGLANSHSIAILEEGMKYETVSIAPEDSQFIQTAGAQVEDIARWFNVELHMIQSTSKVTSWGTGIEQLSLAFVTYTLQKWAVRWEQAIRRDLISDKKRYYAKHNFGSLLRSDLKSRYEAYATARNWGWFSVNDIRALEDLNPIEDGDIYLQPLNMTEPGTPPPQRALSSGRQNGGIPDNQPPEDNNVHYNQLLQEAAGRVLRKEVTTLGKVAKRCASDEGLWRAAIDEFYAEHAGYVASTMRVDAALARWYCGEQKALLLENGVAGLEAWETRRAMELCEIVKGDNRQCRN